MGTALVPRSREVWGVGDHNPRVVEPINFTPIKIPHPHYHRLTPASNRRENHIVLCWFSLSLASWLLPFSSLCRARNRQWDSQLRPPLRPGSQR